MNALVKIGEPAIPLVTERLIALLHREPLERAEASALVDVLGALGPAAIPSLIRVAAESADPWTAEESLGKIVPSGGFGQDLGPWADWYPQSDGPERTGQYIKLELPHIREILEREVTRYRPESPAPQRPAAYLLARWGTDANKARGLEVLNALARTREPFYRPLEAAKLLHRLRAPGTGALLKDLSARIQNEMVGWGQETKDQILTSIAVALYQEGDQSYIELLSAVLRGSNRVAKIDAIRFAGNADDLRLVPVLIERLNDDTSTGSEQTQTVAGKRVNRPLVEGDLATASLQRLTFQEIPRNSGLWTNWWGQHRENRRSDLLSVFVNERVKRIHSVPIEQADQWIAALGTTVEPTAVPLVREYLTRSDLQTTAHTDFGGPIGQYGPPVVTYLLRFVQHDPQRGRVLLRLAVASADATIRHYAAWVVASYDRRAAADILARDLGNTGDVNHFVIADGAADLLLALGDARGVRNLLDRLDRNGSDEAAVRSFANALYARTCEALHDYTQAPLSCDRSDTPAERLAAAQQWRSWWNANPGFQLKLRQAALDRSRRGSIAVC